MERQFFGTHVKMSCMMSGCKDGQQCCWRQLCRRDEKTPLNVLKEGKTDSPIHTDYIHFGGATTLIVDVDEATPSVLRHALNERLVVLLTAQHGVHVFAENSIRHRTVIESVEDSAGFLIDET